MGSVTTGRVRPAEQLGVELPVSIRVTEYRLRHGHSQTDGCWRDASSRQWDACGPTCGRFVVAAPAAPPRSGSSRARWWSATSATTSASPCPSPTRCWPFAHEGTAAAVEAVYTEAVGAPSAGWRPVRRRDARPLRRRPERGHGGLEVGPARVAA